MTLLAKGQRLEAVPTAIHEREAVISTLEEFIKRLGLATARKLPLGLPPDREPTPSELRAIPPMARRAALVSNVTGKNFAFAAVNPTQYREGLVAANLPSFIVDAVLSIQDMWSAGSFDMTTGDGERLAGRPPRSFEDVLRDAKL